MSYVVGALLCVFLTLRVVGCWEPCAAPASGATTVMVHAPVAVREATCSFASFSLGTIVAFSLTFLLCGVVVTAISMVLGVVMLPIEIVVLSVLTATSGNFFYLAMLILWKYDFLFVALVRAFT